MFILYITETLHLKWQLGEPVFFLILTHSCLRVKTEMIILVAAQNFLDGRVMGWITKTGLLMKGPCTSASLYNLHNTIDACSNWTAQLRPGIQKRKGLTVMASTSNRLLLLILMRTLVLMRSSLIHHPT